MLKTLTLLSLLIFITGCPVDPYPKGLEEFWSQCLEITDLRNSSAVAKILEGSAYDQKKSSEESDGANVLTTTIWKNVKIPVCWEDLDPTGIYAIERQTVRDAVDRTWNSIYEGTSVLEEDRVEFVGWDECNGNNNGIRIKIKDVGPYVASLGSLLKNRTSGMVLNFTFDSWSTGCKSSLSNKLRCIDYIAVHEFGHALGLAHEQNRNDTPDSCDLRQGSNGDLYIGEWDKESVMNYCSSSWINDGNLTATDIIGVRSIYAPHIESEFCEVYGELVDENFNKFTDPNAQSPFDFNIDLSSDIHSYH